MKIVNKTYLLIAILIGTAVVNLVLLYEHQLEGETQSYSVIKTGDIKVNAEAVAGLATLIASGNENEKEALQKEITLIQKSIDTIAVGGEINKIRVDKVPESILPEFQKVISSWNEYKQAALKVEKTTVFDQEASSALNYLREKNGELVLLTDRLDSELNSLDRDYIRHKEIASELGEYARELGQQVLLISVGEEENNQEKLAIEKLQFEIGLRKLLQISTADLGVEKVGEIHEKLKPIPRENSEALRMIDPLWESMQSRINILEERALLSPDYNLAKNEMNNKKAALYMNIDILLDAWNSEIQEEGKGDETIIQIMSGVNILVFIIVFFVIRQSLSPLETITNALSKIKEGVYGEKIEYNSSDEIGELVKTYNIMTDTIKQKEEDAKKTDIAKDEFLAMITHELKTPLVPIQGYTDILLSEHLGKLTEKQRERISIIKSSSETLLGIISDLLDAQKLELGQLRMKIENSNIKDTIIDTVQSLTPLATENNAVIITNVGDVIIGHDSERIKQVVSNLIKNSINATTGKQGKIEVTLENMQDKIRINIKDNGKGIPSDKQSNLFNKFYQVDASLTREKGGSGLGLAICKGIIENHGGDISVKSSAGQGAEFSFTLPKQRVQKSPIGIA